MEPPHESQKPSSQNKEDGKLKEHEQERALLLKSLFSTGERVFGDEMQFNDWLRKNNYFLDYQAPIDFLGTASDIRFIESRLIGMEFGDNA